MKINDQRHNPEGVRLDVLESACVYVDCHGQYVFYSHNEEMLINLDNGDIYTSSHYDIDDKFVKVNAVMEIK
jgi:hypothetical protein